MSFINETDFVIENKQLVYPEIVTDGLQLYYDAKGKRDTDYHRGRMLDMSGNKNHGHLQNFAYEKHSGYKNGLVFDYIDDKLVRPELSLKPDDFTFMLNGNIISFSPDGTIKRIQNGEVIESKGFNLIKNGDFVGDTYRWSMSYTTDTFKTVKGLATIKAGQQYGGVFQNLHSPSKMPATGEKYYFCANIERQSSGIQLYLNDGRGQTQAAGPSIGFVSNTRILSDNPTALIIKLQDNNTSGWTESKISNIVVINLTETFGAGNEPTKEQMDEIINRFGFIPNAQDLIDRIEYKGNDLGDMENIIDGLYKTEVLSGEEIYTDKADDAVVHVEVDGKSLGGGSGKNLIYGSEDFSMTISTPYSTGHLLSEKFRDSSVLYIDYLSGSRYVQALEQSVTANKAGYYTVSFYAKSSTSGTVMQCFFYSPNTTISSLSSQGKYVTAADGTSSITLTDKWEKYWITWQQTETSTDKKIILGRLNAGISYGDVYISQPQLEEGQVATDYEPTPHPDAPVEIHSLNDFDVVSSVGRRNLIPDSEKEVEIINNTTREIHKPTKTFNAKGNQTYIFSAEVFIDSNVAGSQIQLHYLPTDTDYKTTLKKTTPNVWTKIAWQFTTTQEKKDAYIRFDNDGSKSEGLRSVVKFRKAKIEEVAPATPYSPAPEDIAENSNHPAIDKINILLDEPLRSVEDVRDRLFRGTDGLWKVERNISSVLFDGYSNTNWGYADNSNYSSSVIRFNYRNADIKPSLDKLPDSYSNRFPNFGYQKSLNDNEEIRIHGTDNQIMMFILESRLSTSDVSGLLDWFKSNPTLVLYCKTNPLIETLPQNLQDKLNNLRSLQDSNYVYTIINDKTDIISERLRPTLHAKFLYNNWYKEDRVINNLMIYNRALTNEEMLQNYKTIKRRWGM